MSGSISNIATGARQTRDADAKGNFECRDRTNIPSGGSYYIDRILWSRTGTADVLPTKEVSNVGTVSNISTRGSSYVNRGLYDMVPCQYC